MGERLPKLVAALAVALGIAAILAGVSVFLDAWQASQAWAGSAEAQHAAVSSEAPIWLDEPVRQQSPASQPDAPHAVSAPSTIPQPIAIQPVASQHAAAQPRLRAPDRDEVDVASRASEPDPARLPDVPASHAPPATLAAPGDVELAEVDFRFLVPPEPGAHARLAVTLQNRAALPTGPVSVIVPKRWLQSFEVLGAIPAVLDDSANGEQERRFVFGGLAPGARQTVEVHVLATGEEIDAPPVRVALTDDEIGQARPRTVAPRPRPGPARAITIPRLGVTASVVPVPWEPPPFLVGQVQGTAAVSLGNTVLIGHLAGPLGDVFARLDRLRPGDEVVAMSRGLEYRFVVSAIAVRPYDDVLPTQPTETPRLTLMTCTGQWSIVRQDYSHRLWVVAEPPELAEQTIRVNAERAAEAAREAEAAAAVRATHEAEPATGSSAAQVDAAAATPESQAAAAPTIVAIVSPAPVVAAPIESASSTAPSEGAPDETRDFAPGIAIDAPTTQAPVARRIIVRGRRTAEADPRAPLWLLVRAEIAGSRWYALDRPLEPDKEGAWQVDVELGGPPGVRHEIRAGAVDAAADRALRQHAVERPGQPLDDLPEGFRTGARVVVERR